MVDRRRVASLFMTHYSDRPGDDRSAELERVRRHVVGLGVGGYCVFGGDVESARRLASTLAAAAGRPLLVASDLEQGLGQQLKGGTVFPSQMALGAAGSPELAAEVGLAVAREAAFAGINIVFAPVADLATEPRNPIVGARSYGSDPDTVAALVKAYVSGCQSAGVAATVKHFPGHGETVTDSHIELPIISVPPDVLAARELVPFRAAVRAGVRAVMVGHLAVPEVSGSDVPASLSPSVVEGLLRHELGFDGVVVTDALNMGSVAGESRPGEASVRAFLAGADVLLMPVNVEESIEAMVQAVASGRVSERRVERSLERIARLAAATGERDLPAPSYADHEALALRVARRAVTRVRVRAGSSSDRGPSNGGEALLVAVVDSKRPPDLDFLSCALQKLSPGGGLRVISEVTPEEDLARLIRDARGARALTLLAFDRPAAWRGSLGPSSVVRECLNKALRVSGGAAVVVFGSPGLLPIFEAADTLLCAYDGSPPMQEAALDALLGDGEAPGRLPSPSTRSAADGSR